MTKDIKASNISESIGTILAKICYKAADSIGAEFSIRTNAWRARNALKLVEKANEYYIENSRTGNETANPRLVHKIIDEGSWIEDDSLQSMWAGLLASACTESGDDESNLILIEILSKLTSLQTQVLNYSCENCEKRVSKGGWIYAPILSVELDELQRIAGEKDFHRLDRELDHLRTSGLIGHGYGGGFDMRSTNADITPTGLALQLYIRCQGSLVSPIEFFDATQDIN